MSGWDCRFSKTYFENYGTMGVNTFKKSERLCSKKLIKELFNKGSSFYLSPFKVYFLDTGLIDIPHQLLFSVPKRNHKKAVDRNLLKRRMREAYRLNKSIVKNASPKLIAYIYTHTDVLPFSQIEKKLIGTLQRLPK